MTNIEKYIRSNDYNNLKELLLKYENKESELRIMLNSIIDDNALFIIYILFEIAHERGISFWYNQIGFILSFYLSHINGAERTSLAMFKKSYEINPDKLTLSAILDFKDPPEIVLTDSEYEFYLNIFKKW